MKNSFRNSFNNAPRGSLNNNGACSGIKSRVVSGIARSMVSSLIAVVLLVCAGTSTALAAGMNSVSTTYVRDHYQLLSTNDVQEFEERAAQLATTYQCAPYITIVNNIGQQNVRSYAESYWQENDLGINADKDGIMFLFAVDSRDYVTITHGQGETGGITIFTDYRIAQIEDEVVSELADNNWEDACDTFLDEVSQTLSYYQESGTAWDVSNDPKEARIAFLAKLAVAILLSLGIAIAFCWYWAGQMKSARMQTQASAYLEEDSFELTRKEDHFIRTVRTVAKIEHERDHDSGHGGSFSGGSTISSSGFGGSSGGKF